MSFTKNINIKFLCFLLIFSFNALERESFATVAKNIQLKLGQQMSIYLGEFLEMHISRKGLIDISHENGPKWNIIGLKKGITLITVTTDRGSERKWIIKTISEKKTKLNTCSSDPQSCIDKNSFKAFTFFELSGNINFNSHGVLPEIMKNQELANPQLTRGNWKIRDSKSRNLYKLLGNPIVILSGGRKSTLKTGGQLAFTETIDQRQNTIWKEHGIEISLEASTVSEGIVHVKMDSKIVLPTNNKGFEMARFNGNIIAPLNNRFLIAEGYLQIQGSNESKSYLLEKVPLIGPIFNISRKKSSSRKLRISLYIEKMNIAKNRLP